MARRGLFRPFALDRGNVDQYVGNNIGAFTLGAANERGEFVPRYVGRSDTDVNQQLKSWIGRYQQFEYRHFLSTRAAFEKECRLFHDLGGTERLDNTAHPARPAASDWVCPHCSAYR
jgi:hypothetical protein